MNENKYFIVMTTVVCIAIMLILFTRSESGTKEDKTINGIDIYERCMDKLNDQYDCTQMAITWLREKSNESRSRVQ